MGQKPKKKANLKKKNREDVDDNKAKEKREDADDSEAEWEYTLKEGGEEKKTTWGQWAPVLTYPVGDGNQEGVWRLLLGRVAKFGNFTGKGIGERFKAYKSAMCRNLNSGVYEWRVALYCARYPKFDGTFVFYCGKAESLSPGVHGRVRDESLGKQGGGEEGMNAFFHAVLAHIEKSHTDAEFSVEFQARSSARTYRAKQIEDDRKKKPEDRKGYFPCTSCRIIGDEWVGVFRGGCTVEHAEREILLAKFDYAACKTNNNQYRLKDFETWLAKKFKELPRRVVVRPALTKLDIGLSDDALNNILVGLRNHRVNDSVEIAEVLKIASLEAYKKGRADALGEVSAAVKELGAQLPGAPPPQVKQVIPLKPPKTDQCR